MTNDPFNLDRFVDAQRDIYQSALAELARGRKQGHWMWFIFPQLRGLGSSPTAEFYGLASADEARAYLAHPVLGPRLRECTRTVTGVGGRTASQIFGFPDELKFNSSMTLFEAVADDPQLFRDALDRYYDGRRDERTLQLAKLLP